MRCLQLYMVAFLIISCASKQNSVAGGQSKTITQKCPEDGVCTFEVSSNQSMNYEKDGIGMLYPKISEGEKLLIKFEYTRNEIPDTVDGSYRELVYLELDPNALDIELNDYKLQSVKALFGRFCYCKGQAGYYKLRKGQLRITKISNTEYSLRLNFTVSEVPQVLTSIEENISLN